MAAKLEYCHCLSMPAYEHGNDSLFYTAVENDFLIAVLWHFVSFLSFGCL